ncbi:hypothetical protein [Halomonas sp. DP1Y21-3]|uniref:hypothetical protein n=1 Tax=Halomonas sp. DP1Y21-3 TaxID=2859080 RepID=UPI0021BD103F|nr:hypothetical protein [Halomonas sp. DP1Y21-3]
MMTVYASALHDRRQPGAAVALGLLVASVWLIASPALASADNDDEAASTGLDNVTKQVFEMPSYTTVGGDTIAPIRVGW